MKSVKSIKVVLDSDVIIHFIKGDCLALLPTILPAYDFILLDIVYEKELAMSHRVIIEKYCEMNKITYFTTMDFLYQAMTTGVMTEEECDSFIAKVTSMNSKLPVVCMKDFKPRLRL